MKVLIVDDHVLIRDAMRAVLQDALGRGETPELLESASGEHATAVLGRHADLDLVLLDLNLPDGDGLDMLAEIRDAHPSVSVVVLSGREDRATMLTVLRHGAQGFIPKSATRDVMVGALRLVFSGGTYVPPEALAASATVPTPAAPAAQSPQELGLTERQIDVLALMMQGRSNKLICRALGLAETTVKNHVTAILKAMGAANRTEAAIRATEMGWKFRP
jgi:DNA-binding NarL/FixJ family response regulator